MWIQNCARIQSTPSLLLFWETKLHTLALNVPFDCKSCGKQEIKCPANFIMLTWLLIPYNLVFSVMFLACIVTYKLETTDRKRPRKIRKGEGASKDKEVQQEELYKETSALESTLQYIQDKKRFVFPPLWTVNLPLGFRPCHHFDCSWSSMSDRPRLLTSDCTQLYLPENKPI